MWLQICKLSIMQSKRKMKQADQKSIIIIIVILLGFQVYLYKGIKEGITQLRGVESVQLFQSFFVFSFILLFITFLLLNFFKKEDRSFLLRLPIKKGIVFKAYYYPLLLSLWVLYLFEGISAIIAILQSFNPRFIVLFIGFFTFGCLFSLLLAFTVRCSIEIIFSRYKKIPKFFELFFYFIFLVVYFIVCIVKPFPLIQLFWENTILYYDPITNLIILILSCILLFGFIHFYISSRYSWDDTNPHKIRSKRFTSSIKYNGFLFDLIQVLRSWENKKGILFPVILGNMFILIPYTLMGNEQTEEYFFFLIISIGLACVQHSAYSNENHRSIVNISINLKKLLIGKAIFYLVLSSFFFAVSSILLSLLGVSLEPLFLAKQLIKLFLFTSLALVVNSMSFDQHHNTGKLLITIYSLILYVAVNKGIEFVSFNIGWMHTIIVLLCIGVSVIIYVLVSKKRLERSLYVSQ
jgi:hypothetical protein